MNQRKVKCILLAFVLAISACSKPPAPVPLLRKSPDFSINEPSGKIAQLSSLKGKVVVLEFLFIRSQHCLRVAQTLNKLHSELGPRGFEPVGVVFDPPNNVPTDGRAMALMVDYFKLTYPVGYSSKSDVDSYLGRTGNEVLNIPQVVVIDRAGMIRATSGGAHGDPKLEEESSLRTLVDSLLKESGPAS